MFVALTLTLAPLAATAAESSRRSHSARLEQLGRQPGALWRLVPSLMMILLWGKPGCGIDPSGACVGGTTAPPSGQGQELEPGCGADPDGLCSDGR